MRRLPSAEPTFETGYALFERGRGIVGYHASFDQALEEAKHAGAREVGYAGEDPRRANPPRPSSGLASPDAAAVAISRKPALALKRTTLREFSYDEVMSISTTQAYRTLKPYFTRVAHLHTAASGAKAWNTELGALEQLLRTNIKTAKSRAGHALAVLGLSLVPHALAFGATPDPKEVCTYKKKSQATLCLQATKECACVCLVHTGNNANTRYAYEIKFATAQALLAHPAEFLRLLTESIGYWKHRLSRYRPKRESKTAKQKRRQPHRLVVRLNMLSDVPWELVFPSLFEIHRDVMFYDYTKVPGRVTPPNYDLTFSFSGSVPNLAECHHELRSGRRIAAAMLLPGEVAKHGHETERQRQKRYPLPKQFLGLQVIDGDLDDLRFLDPPGVVVGLRYKDPMGQTKTVQGVPKKWAKHRAGFDPRQGAKHVKYFLVRYHLIDGVPVADTTPLTENVIDPNTVVS